MKRRSGIVAALTALAIVAWPASASAEGRPPRLERFVARYNPTSTTTFYIAVAGDPDGGKLTYRWSLSADCGYLTDPETSGPSQGFQHGPPARRPDGCSNEEDRRARITLRITDPEGCTLVYTQGARDETEHVAPEVELGACPPGAASQPASPSPSPAGGSFPLVPVLLVLAGAGALLALAKARPRVGGGGEPAWDAPAGEAADVWGEPRPPERTRPRRSERSRPEPPPKSPPVRTRPEEPAEPEPIEYPRPDAAPSRAEPPLPPPVFGDVLPTIRASEALIDDDVPSFMDDDELDLDLPLFAEDEPPAGTAPPPAGCREGAVRKLDNDFVAHDTVLAGTVRARTLRSESSVDVPPDDPAEILRLAAGMSDDAPLEVEVEIPVRLVTVVSSRREVCRGGAWVPEVDSATHDGPARVERLRAIVTGPDELERFARDILAKRLRTLTAARRRLESALAAMRDRG